MFLISFHCNFPPAGPFSAEKTPKLMTLESLVKCVINKEKFCFVSKGQLAGEKGPRILLKAYFNVSP